MKEVIVSDFGKYSPFEVPLGILKKFGIWSEDGESKAHRLKRFFKHAFFLELFIVIQFAYFFDYESNVDLAFALCYSPSVCGIFLKTLNFTLKSPEIGELLAMTKELYDEFPLKPSLLRRLAVLSKVTKFCFVSLTVAEISVTIGSIFDLPVRTWTPFDVNNNRIGYWITALVQLSGLLQKFKRIVKTCYDKFSYLKTVMPFGYPLVATDLFPAFFLCFSAGFIDTLNTRIGLIRRQLMEHSSKQDFDFNVKELKECIVLQEKIYAFNQKFQETFSPVFLIQGAISVIVLCTTYFMLLIVSHEIAGVSKNM